MGRNEDKGAKLFSVVPSEKTRGDGHRKKHMTFHLNSRKHFITVRVTKDWKRFLREVAEPPAMEVHQTHLDKVLRNLL